MAHRPRLNCLKFSTLAVFLLLLQVSFAQSKKPVTGPSPFPDLERAVELRKKELGGELMIFVANRDTVIYQKAYGDVNNRTQAPVGAASAWFTAALVLQLVDEGKLSLDDKVTQYLPVYGSYFKNFLTVRHCLTHFTGFKSEPFKPAGAAAKSRFASLEEEVDTYAKLDILSNAGEAYQYNGMGVNIAARVVEVITKKKFEQLTRQRIFAPLGMRNTTFATDDGSAPNPAFGAKSTAADFVRFLQMLLNNGTLGGKKILSEQAVAEMRKVQVEPTRIKAVPKNFGGLPQTLGAWAIEREGAAGGQASALAAPSLVGVWPVVDFVRGYAFVLVPKTAAGEENTAVLTGLKGVLDAEWKGGRK